MNFQHCHRNPGSHGKSRPYRQPASYRSCAGTIHRPISKAQTRPLLCVATRSFDTSVRRNAGIAVTVHPIQTDRPVKCTVAAILSDWVFPISLHASELRLPCFLVSGMLGTATAHFSYGHGSKSVFCIHLRYEFMNMSADGYLFEGGRIRMTCRIPSIQTILKLFLLSLGQNADVFKYVEKFSFFESC